MARSGPPAYAWDWFARQRLLWRETRRRLERASAPAATRYAAVETRSDVLALLRADYARDDLVRTAVHAVVAEVAFLGRTDVPFERLGETGIVERLLPPLDFVCLPGFIECRCRSGFPEGELS